MQKKHVCTQTTEGNVASSKNTIIAIAPVIIEKIKKYTSI
jgi:hypothetical protein